MPINSKITNDSKADVTNQIDTKENIISSIGSVSFPEIERSDTIAGILEEGIKYLNEWKKFDNGEPHEKLLYHFLKIDKVFNVFMDKKEDCKSAWSIKSKKKIASSIYESMFSISQNAMKIPLLKNEYEKKQSKGKNEERFVAMEILSLVSPFKIYGQQSKQIHDSYASGKLDKKLADDLDKCFKMYFELGEPLAKNLNSGSMPEFLRDITYYNKINDNLPEVKFPKIECGMTLKGILEYGIKYLKEWESKFKNSSKTHEQMLYYFLKIDRMIKNFEEATKKHKSNSADNLEIANRVYKYVYNSRIGNIGITSIKERVKDILDLSKKYENDPNRVKMEILKCVTPLEIENLKNDKSDINFENFFYIGEELAKRLENGAYSNYCKNIHRIIVAKKKMSDFRKSIVSKLGRSKSKNKIERNTKK